MASKNKSSSSKAEGVSRAVYNHMVSLHTHGRPPTVKTKLHLNKGLRFLKNPRVQADFFSNQASHMEANYQRKSIYICCTQLVLLSSENTECYAKVIVRTYILNNLGLKNPAYAGLPNTQEA